MLPEIAVTSVWADSDPLPFYSISFTASTLERRQLAQFNRLPAKLTSSHLNGLNSR